MRRSALVVVLGVIMGCASVTTIPDEDATGVVTWVYDGDTLDIEIDGSTVEVRLLGVNSPERGECLHEGATEFLTGFIKGREVTVDVTGVDQFGRALAEVHYRDTHVNQVLVVMGLAIATTSGGSPSLMDAEEEAFMSRAGLWGDACGSVDSPDVVIDPASVTNPPGPDDDALDAERILIHNEGETVVALTGWAIRDESSRHRYHFPPGAHIGPGEVLEVASSSPGWEPGGSPVWNNDGDLILLLDEHGGVVDRMRYAES